MSAPGDRGLDLASDAALDVALLSNRVRRQYNLPHSMRDDVQRLALRVMAALDGHDLPPRGDLCPEDAEAVLQGILGALRAHGMSREVIVAAVNRWSTDTIRPEAPQP